eukprot:gene10359-67215_t
MTPHFGGGRGLDGVEEARADAGDDGAGGRREASQRVAGNGAGIVAWPIAENRNDAVIPHAWTVGGEEVAGGGGGEGADDPPPRRQRWRATASAGWWVSALQDTARLRSVVVGPTPPHGGVPPRHRHRSA